MFGDSGSSSSTFAASGGNRLSLLLPTISSLSTNRERDMQKKVETLQIRLSQVKLELESTKEAQRIVLDTKESVLRSLLKQNSQVTQERDIMARRTEDLTATVEQLTGLLRNIQNKRQKASSATATAQQQSSGCGDSATVPATSTSKRFNNPNTENQYSISGGGGYAK